LTTDVAEETKTGTNIEQQAQEPDLSKAVGEDSKGEIATGSQPEGTGSEGTELNLDDVYADVMGKKPDEAAKLPGKSDEELAEEKRKGEAAAYFRRAVAPESKQNYINVLMKEPPDGWGLSQADATELAADVFQRLADQHSNYESFSAERDKQIVKKVLSEPEFEVYSGRKYANRTEEFQGIKAAVLKAAEDSGAYIPAAKWTELKSKLETVFENKLQAAKEKAGLVEGDKSETVNNGITTANTTAQARAILDNPASSLDQKRAAYRQIYGMDYPG
jgi:hypothetical protein